MIRLEDVSLGFGDVSVLEDVSLSVERDEFVALVGPNGAGKTTLLRTINGLLTPDSGTVALDDRPVSELSSTEISRRVATVPQNTHVGFSFRAEQLVEMGRTPHRSRLNWTDDTAPVERAMARTETLELRDRLVDDLSGGERQRVLLARALAQEPDGLVLDEPTASLDINHQIQVLGLVRELVEEGHAAIAAIHDLDLAARFCDRLALLADGEIAASGPPEQVLSDSRLADAFGTTTAVAQNHVTGTPTVAAVTDRPPREATVHVAGSGAGGAAAIRTLWREGFDVTAGLVPEGDVAAELAVQLDCQLVSAPAFEQPTDDRLRAATRLAQDADVLVLTSGPGRDDQYLLPDVSTGVEASSADPPRIRADLGGTGPRAVTGDGGETAVVDSQDELLSAVLECVDSH